MSEFNFTTTEPESFTANIYIQPVQLEIADFKNSFTRVDAARAKLLGITEYDDGAVLCEVLFQNPGDDNSSWYNCDMPQMLQAILGANEDHSISAPRYIPVRWVRDMILFSGIELHPNEHCTIRLKLNEYQGFKGDSSAKLVLNQNLTAAVLDGIKAAEEAEKKSDKREFARRAKRVATFLELSGRKTEAEGWRQKAEKALEEKMPEYCMI